MLLQNTKHELTYANCLILDSKSSLTKETKKETNPKG